jgi:hypothetical protein
MITSSNLVRANTQNARQKEKLRTQSHRAIEIRTVYNLQGVIIVSIIGQIRAILGIVTIVFLPNARINPKKENLYADTNGKDTVQI